MLRQAPLAGAQLSLRPIREGDDTPGQRLLEELLLTLLAGDLRLALLSPGKAGAHLSCLCCQFGGQTMPGLTGPCAGWGCNMLYYYWVPPVQRSQTSVPVSYQLSEFFSLASCIISKVYNCSQWGRGRRSRSMLFVQTGDLKFLIF